jgi:hypothetical protein
MKKMKNYVVLCVTIFIANIGFSQSVDFDLEKYKLPDLRRQSLELQFNLDAFSNNTLVSGVPDLNINKYDGNGYNFDGLGTGIYNYYRNSKARRLTAQGLVSITARGWSKERFAGDSTIQDTYYNDLNHGVSVSIMDQEFFADKWFVGIGFRGSYHNYFRKEVYGNLNDKTEIRRLNSRLLAIPLEFGYGRIEPVQDARQAIYIFEELKKVGRIEKEVSDSDIMELAQLISELKNERFFDARLRKIGELKAIDEFLHEKGYVANNDVAYFTTLMDNWEFGNQFIRESGSQYKAVFEYAIKYNKRDDEIDSDLPTLDRDLRLNMQAGLMYETHKPINLNWQSDLSAYLLYEAYGKYFAEGENDLEKIQSNKDDDYLLAGVKHSLMYIPSTRTDFALNSSLAYSTDLLGKEDNYYHDLNLRGGIGFAMNYYFSPRLRLATEAGISYYLNGIKHLDKDQASYAEMLDASYRYLDLNLSASLTYALF